jgi:hypothetical protein
MNPWHLFWREKIGLDRPLEADAWWRRMLNRHVVAALMNAFPRAATKVFSFSKGELARRLFVDREGGSFLVLRAMYEHADPRKRGDLINRLLMQSPAVKAARNRRIIAQRMLSLALQNMPQDAPSLILAIGGGDGSLEAEVISRNGNPRVYLCIVDKDERAVRENEIALKKHDLAGRGAVFVGTAAGEKDLAAILEWAERHFGLPFNGIGAAICQGIAEYLDMGEEDNRAFAELLAGLYRCTRPEGILLLSQTDYHDRVRYLDRGLSWHMRLRSREEISAEIESAGWKISVCEPEPMELITMCSAIKTDREHTRIDGPSRIRKTPGKKPSPIFSGRQERRDGRR